MGGQKRKRKKREFSTTNERTPTMTVWFVLLFALNCSLCNALFFNVSDDLYKGLDPRGEKSFEKQFFQKFRVSRQLEETSRCSRLSLKSIFSLCAGRRRSVAHVCDRFDAALWLWAKLRLSNGSRLVVVCRIHTERRYVAPAALTHVSDRWALFLVGCSRRMCRRCLSTVITFVPVNETLFFYSGLDAQPTIPPPKSPLEGWHYQVRRGCVCLSVLF